jgi:hypothetical protein
MMPMIATTIRSSISEKPSWRLVVIRVWCSLNFGFPLVSRATGFPFPFEPPEREVSLPALNNRVPLERFPLNSKKEIVFDRNFARGRDGPWGASGG